MFECDKPDGKPCRVMPTRRCPILREAGCPGDPCARFESKDEAPWAADIEQWKAEALRHAWT